MAPHDDSDIPPIITKEEHLSYLQEKTIGIMQRMVIHVALEKPEYPIPHMIRFLEDEHKAQFGELLVVIGAV